MSVSMSDLKIEYIRWSEVHPNDRISKLEGIRVGEYVFSLPVPVPDHAESMFFPLPPVKPNDFWLDCPKPSVFSEKSFRKMRFDRERYTDGIDTFDVWRRAT